jgi:cytochrome b involved in lipid metabolism
MFVLDGSYNFNLNNKIYIMIDNVWFDLTSYTNHPGGIKIFKKYHLKDATSEFNDVSGHYDAFVDGKMKEYEIKNTLLLFYLNFIS